MATGVFLLLPIFVLLPRRRAQQPQTANLSHTLLWSWLVVPLIALAFFPVKEPRHLLPCLVPAVLLIFTALSQVPRPALRRTLTAALMLISITQYLLLTHHRLAAPYFIDHPLGFEAIAATLLPPITPLEPLASSYGSLSPRASELQHWEYSTNFALAGFDPSEAFCLAWQFTPAVVYDLDALPAPGRPSSSIAYRRFEDLFSYTHFTLYNNRLFWPRPYVTLNAQDILANADYILLKNYTPQAAAARFPTHQRLTTVQTPAARILILKSRRPTTPYRELYARQFLGRLPPSRPRDQIELDTICYDLVRTRYFAHRSCDPAEILPLFPAGYVCGRSNRHIYWVGTLVWNSKPKIDEAYKRFLRTAGQPAGG
jgi:hypothetical protein